MTFGGLSVSGRHGPLAGAAAQPRRLALLALVARGGRRGITRAKLLAMLWPDADEKQGRRVLNQALYALRRDLGEEQAIGGTQELRIAEHAIWCDIAEFDIALARGDRAAAVTLYVGPFLDGFRLASAPEFERWADDERTAIEHRFHDAIEQLAREAEDCGELDRAVTWWRRRAASEPLNARVAVATMKALASAGDRNGALRMARIFEALVAQELELPPDREVIECAEWLRRQEPVTTTPQVAAGEPSTPGAALHIAPTVTARSTREPVAIAVLPFADVSAAPDTEAFQRWRDGLAEEIISALAADPALRVSSRSASFAFGHSPDLSALRTALNVTLALEGSVRRSKQHVRITARLIELASGRALWVERAEGSLDSHNAQDQIAARVAARLRATPT